MRRHYQHTLREGQAFHAHQRSATVLRPHAAPAGRHRLAMHAVATGARTARLRSTDCTQWTHRGLPDYPYHETLRSARRRELGSQTAGAHLDGFWHDVDDLFYFLDSLTWLLFLCFLLVTARPPKK